MIIQLQSAIFERTWNAQRKAVQTVSISLLSATFSCILQLWFKRCWCDAVYNDVTRDSIACSLTLWHVTENRYVKYPVHNSWRYESIVLTNRIAGKRMNIKKIKLFQSVFFKIWFMYKIRPWTFSLYVPSNVMRLNLFSCAWCLHCCCNHCGIMQIQIWCILKWNSFG